MRGAGRVVFAAIFLLIVGTLNILYGIGAVADAHWWVNDTRYILTNLHTDLEAEHFRVLWEALVRDPGVDIRRLIEAARLEIWEHIIFWDDAYSVILQAKSELAS